MSLATVSVQDIYLSTDSRVLLSPDDNNIAKDVSARAQPDDTPVTCGKLSSPAGETSRHDTCTDPSVHGLVNYVYYIMDTSADRPVRPSSR